MPAESPAIWHVRIESRLSPHEHELPGAKLADRLQFAPGSPDNCIRELAAGEFSPIDMTNNRSYHLFRRR